MKDAALEMIAGPLGLSQAAPFSLAVQCTDLVIVRFTEWLVNALASAQGKQKNCFSSNFPGNWRKSDFRAWKNVFYHIFLV